MAKISDLIDKYNIPVPRYTSYPTVPAWEKDSFDIEKWKNEIGDHQSGGISLYIHLPFCENLCTFCGCNRQITKNHNVEVPYLQAILQEWSLYQQLFDYPPKLKELHLGGGTPTFFSPKHLEKMLTPILKSCEINSDAELSFEAHPNHTQREHLETLHQLGFKRVSFGIQDASQEIQKAINRIQTKDQIERVVADAREVGYTSINADLVFGLPFQTLRHIEESIEFVRSFKPDRLAFYSYAHVPWIGKVGQRRYRDEDVPKGTDKRKLYERGREKLLDVGYKELGLDHFALPTDLLFESAKNKKLHRNFMGYTPFHTPVMIGLGASSIGETGGFFVQNEKEVSSYEKKMAQGEWPCFRGHGLTEEDKIMREQILNITCKLETSWKSLPEEEAIVKRLQEYVLDGLVHVYDEEGNETSVISKNVKSLKVTELGRQFIRNVAMAFDLRLFSAKPTTPTFSMSI